jgi:hypothetical protein
MRSPYTPRVTFRSTYTPHHRRQLKPGVILDVNSQHRELQHTEAAAAHCERAYISATVQVTGHLQVHTHSATIVSCNRTRVVTLDVGCSTGSCNAQSERAEEAAGINHHASNMSKQLARSSAPLIVAIPCLVMLDALSPLVSQSENEAKALRENVQEF